MLLVFVQNSNIHMFFLFIVVALKKNPYIYAQHIISRLHGEEKI